MFGPSKDMVGLHEQNGILVIGTNVPIYTQREALGCLAWNWKPDVRTVSTLS